MHFVLLRRVMLLLLAIPCGLFADELKVTASKESVTVNIPSHWLPCDVVEAPPNQALPVIPSASILHATKRNVLLPRFDHGRDRIYSGFIALSNNTALGAIHFADEFRNVSTNSDPYPKSQSKKGLQVQMVDDALSLGVKHAALNFNLGQMVALNPDANAIPWEMDGRTFHFHRAYVESADSRIKPLCNAAVIVTLILLNYENPDDSQNKILLHPKYDKACPEKLSAFNTSTDEGLAWFKACVEFLANRYSQKGFPNGRVANYIVGNEVNSHWWWANMGHVDVDTFVADYARTVRICNTAVRKFSSSARVFISLEHHWNIRYAGGDKTQSFRGHDFVDRFNAVVKTSGDFDWNLAFHPYPENLFNPKTWEDKSATFSTNTPRITFKNLELLTEYFHNDPLLFHGKPRHIILSEQGFHSDGTPAGEQLQAAAYCYAFYKADHLDGIDAFILHRHVDHPAEGGLNLGLWRRNGDSAEPLSQKPIYQVFRDADTPRWKEAFRFALPIIGIQTWDEVLRRPKAVSKN